jgi:hypothetical protein
MLEQLIMAVCYGQQINPGAYVDIDVFSGYNFDGSPIGMKLLAEGITLPNSPYSDIKDTLACGIYTDY